jgi:formate hydrogenlyase subunit 3/multisubunit Na+/H+ antiporter MnhD subunit
MLTPFNLAVFIIGMLFILGMITFAAGVLIIVFRTSSTDVKSLAAQTARLAQKGLAEEVSGLVGNASDLVDAMNQLVRTTRGVGIFLMVIGMAMMGLACWLAIQVYQINP